MAFNFRSKRQTGYATKDFVKEYLASKGVMIAPGNVWRVDAKVGDDGFDGTDWDRAFQTFDRAFSEIKSGDIILFRGKVREQLTTPAGVFDVTIIGAANRPRHADDHTESNGARGSSAATWAPPASPTAATPLLKIQQQGWRIANALIQPPTDAAGILLFRDGGSGSSERDGSHFHMLDCRVDAGQDGVENSGGCAFCTIESTLFRAQTAKALKNTVGAGIGTLLNWRILDNQFSAITTAVVLPLSHSLVKGNMIDAGLNLTGGVAPNIVTENVFLGDYSNTGGYVAVSGDFWFNNHALDAAETEVDADGKTNAVPAA